MRQETPSTLCLLILKPFPLLVALFTDGQMGHWLVGERPGACEKTAAPLSWPESPSMVSSRGPQLALPLS